MESSTERCFQMFRDYFGLAAVVAGFHAERELRKVTRNLSSHYEQGPRYNFLLRGGGGGGQQIGRQAKRTEAF